MKRQFLIWPLASLLILGQVTLPGLAQLPAGTPAQQPKPSTSELQKPDDEETVKITTNLVQVDAVVTDKYGKLVTDLRPDEVRILEDGREQKITHFSVVTSESPAATRPVRIAPSNKNAPPLPPVKLNQEDIRRTLALVVDDLGLSFESMYDVRRALKKFVDEQMQPGDLVAIIRTSGGIGALQQFTADKRQLYAAIESVKWYASGRAGVGAFAPIAVDPLQIEAVGQTTDDNQGNSAGLRPPTRGDSGSREALAAKGAAEQLREDVFSAGTLGAIRYVVTGMRELPGRKSILLVSDGFKITRRGDPQFSYRMILELRRLIDAANRATVVISTMNATGLQTLSLSADDSTGGRMSQIGGLLQSRRTDAFELQEGLDYLARESGGIAIRNSNDLSGGIRRVMEDQKSYYLIGYRPEQSTFDAKTGRRTFHRLSLKISRRGKFNVRMRNGFYGVADDEPNATATTPRQRLIAALTSPFSAGGVRLRLTSLFANDAEVGSYMRSLLHINAEDLTFSDLPDGKHQADFDVVALTLGDNGNIIDQVNQSYTMTLAGGHYQRLRREGFVYFLTLPIKHAGAYQLRAALRDRGSERVGSASQFIEVPDITKNRLVVSGILVAGMDHVTPKERSTAAATDPDTSPGNQTVAANEWTNATNSAAIRQFKLGEVLQYSFVIYNGRLGKATGQPQLSMQVGLFRDRRPIFSGRDKPVNGTGQADLKRITVGGALKLGRDLAPGDYVLQIMVTDPLADEKHRVAAQWIDFEVLK